ncbi:SCO3374 family protein [Streptomyces fungicidicus]|uniref:SCO3374 family protein n=1 Tax=Streptomyces fungicidicus TaxID=68203 RepID=UPI001E3FB407|nr:SCO3374 family protein [Streptomyces fungicidicus]
MPFPRRPLPASAGELRLWYEDALGWPTVPGAPLRLAAGVRFDVLDLPAEAGGAALERLGRPCGGSSGAAWRRFPVALCGGRMRLLVAAGSAEELPGLLEWLDWGAVELDLVAVGAGGVMDAPWPSGAVFGRGVAVGGGALPGEEAVFGCGAAFGGVSAVGGGPLSGEEAVFGCGAAFGEEAAFGGVSAFGGEAASGPGAVAGRPLPLGRGGSQGAAVWLRPPGPERDVEASLPTLSAMGTRGTEGDSAGPPDLVRLVNTVATQIHRVRLRRAGAAAAEADGQPLAFS